MFIYRDMHDSKPSAFVKLSSGMQLGGFHHQETILIQLLPEEWSGYTEDDHILTEDCL